MLTKGTKIATSREIKTANIFYETLPLKYSKNKGKKRIQLTEVDVREPRPPPQCNLFYTALPGQARFAYGICVYTMHVAVEDQSFTGSENGQ